MRRRINFLTHSDYDHVGGRRAFQNACLYLSEKEETMITGGTPRMLIKYNSKLSGYKLLADREAVTVDGVRVQIISAPGHTPGSACYMIEDKILVTGDVLRIHSDGQATPFLPVQNMNHKEDRNSLEMLKTEGILSKAHIIASGHTGVFMKST